MEYNISINQSVNEFQLRVIHDYIRGIENLKFDNSKDIICQKYRINNFELESFINQTLFINIVAEHCNNCNSDFSKSFSKRAEILKNLKKDVVELSSCKNCQLEAEEKEFEEKLLEKIESKDNLLFVINSFKAPNFEKIIELDKSVIFDNGKLLKIEGVKSDDDKYIINIKS